MFNSTLLSSSETRSGRSSCLVFGCYNLSYHFFPKDPAKRREWETAVKKLKVGRSFTKGSRICGAHFKDSDFSCKWPNGRDTLYKSAVPSIFPWTVKNDADVQIDLKPQSFEPASVIKTYSRTPKATYLPEQPYWDVMIDNLAEHDPLNTSEDDTMNNGHSEPSSHSRSSKSRKDVANKLKLSKDRTDSKAGSSRLSKYDSDMSNNGSNSPDSNQDVASINMCEVVIKSEVEEPFDKEIKLEPKSSTEKLEPIKCKKLKMGRVGFEPAPLETKKRKRKPVFKSDNLETNEQKRNPVFKSDKTVQTDISMNVSGFIQLLGENTLSLREYMELRRLLSIYEKNMGLKDTPRL